MVAPELTDMVTAAVLLVTVPPKASLRVTTGCVVKAEPLALPAAEVVSVAWVAAPTVGVMLWVAVVTLPEVKVSVYAVPAVPLMPTPEKVATPATALTVVVPTVVPFPLTVMVTAAVLLVTMLPAASLSVTTGWVVKAEPLTLPAAEVVSVAWLAAPTVGVMLWLAVVTLPEVKVSVYAVPAVPLMPTPVKVATPATALTVVVPSVVPLPLTVMVTEAVLLVTVLPAASLIAITG